MTGLIGVIANDAARFTQFTACMIQMDEPEGSRTEIRIGGDWCGARNALAQIVLDEGRDWLWFMDDDHVFAPSMLTRLLSHGLPLVTPICLTRQAPFRPVQFSEKLTEGDKVYLPVPLDAMRGDGPPLVELEAGGCAGMLIRREVLEAIEPPWFEYADRSEDIIFCEKAKAAGFGLVCDLSCRLGHIAVAVIEPAVVNGEWAIGLTVGGAEGMRLAVSFDDNPKAP